MKTIKLSVGLSCPFDPYWDKSYLPEYLAKKQKYPKASEKLRDLETETCLSETVLDEFFSSESEKKTGQRSKAANKDISDSSLCIYWKMVVRRTISWKHCLSIKIITNNRN